MQKPGTAPGFLFSWENVFLTKNPMDNKSYFTALGQLAYAVAMADGTVQTEERARIFHFVISQLVELEEETRNGSQALEAFYLEKEFHRLKDENASMEIAYDMFIDFLKENRNDFDEDRKKTCVEVMEKVAGAYNGIEEPERKLIDKIKSRIENI